LREFRERKEMSQEQLAAAAELDRSFISLVERGIQSPNIVVLLKVAEVLKVSPSEIIKRTELILADLAKERPRDAKPQARPPRR
jgi:transcriptional regulator with XRE-family HTH domain